MDRYKQMTIDELIMELNAHIAKNIEIIHSLRNRFEKPYLRVVRTE